MQENEITTNKNEISLADVWANIWNNKIFILIIVSIMSFVLLVSVFVYNKNTGIIQNKFAYEFIGIEENSYPDSSSFNYHKLLSQDFLETVKASSTDFKDIDINNLSKNYKTNIKKIEIVNEDNVVTKSFFEINMPLKPFKNDITLAEGFIKAIHREVIDVATDKNTSLLVRNYFDTDSNNTFISDINLDYLSYDEITNLIKIQYNELSNKINEIPNSHTQLKELFNDIKFWYDNELLIDLIISEIEIKKYVRNDAKAIKNAQIELNLVSKKIQRNTNIINELTLKFNELFSGTPLTGESNLLLDEITKSMLENIDLNIEKERNEAILNAANQNFDNVFDDTLISNTAEFNEKINVFNEHYLLKLNDKTKYKRINDVSEFEIIRKIDLKLGLIAIVGLSGLVGVTSGLIRQSVINSKEQD